MEGRKLTGMEAANLINREILFMETPGFYPRIQQATVQQVSPNGKCIRLRVDNKMRWMVLDDLEVLDVLG